MILLKEQFNIEIAFMKNVPIGGMKVWYYLDKMGGQARSAPEIYKSMPDTMMTERTAYKQIRILLDKDIIEDNRLNISENLLTKGVYSISNGDEVYVGQSKNIKKRWSDHKNQVNLGIHRYFKNVQLDDLKFEIVCECEEDKLLLKELLIAQKLKSEGKTVLNEDNFTLL
tara:strand:- start:639 stop:1148 length:510 start_codon:yes stop_codon:yes gene_type:complete